MVETTINSKAINTLLDSIPECILFTDLEGNITSFNTKAKEEFFTISKKNLKVGKSIFDYIAESTNAQFNDNFKKVKNGGEIVEDKYHFKTSAGKLIIFQFSLAPVYNQSVINQLCVTGHEVSQLMENDQRNIEQSVLENERKYRSLTENSIDAILLTKPTGEILSANAAACNMFGLSEKEICERGRDKIMDITDPNLEKLLIERSRTGSARGELTLIRNDGTRFPGEVSSAIFTDVDGNQKTSMVIRDVTKRKKEEFALQQSEARLQGIIASQTNYILRTDLNGIYTYYNQKFSDDFAWIHNCENLIGIYCMHSIMAYDHQKVQNIVAKCIATPNIVYQVEIDKPAKNNGVKTTVWDFICLTDADNRPTEIQCIGIDISERKKIETAYINSLQEKNTILETIGDGFFAVDNNWTVTYWNHHAEESLGKLKKETIGQHLWELFPTGINTESYKKYHQAFETNRMVHFEDYHPPLKRWYDVSAYPSNNNLSVFFKDITQRKKIEQQIRDSEEVRHLVIDAAMDAIICMDTSGIITVWNPQAEKVFGWKENEMIGRALADTIIPPQYRDSHLTGIKKYHETGQGPILRNPFEITGINKWGHEFPIELSVVPIKQKDSEFFCAFIRDITDRKLASNLLKDLNDDLQKQAKLLATSNEELERYAHVASHDLQEPLRMVTNFLQLLQKKYDDKLDETAQKYINFAVDGAGRMKTLVMDLLEFSKISTAKLPHKLINLNDVVTHITQALKASIDESNAAINVQFLPEVLGNESQLSQLFQNLISNAIKYRGIQQPIIDIGYTEKAEEWQFYVKDNGIGIDAKFFDKIFIIFQRLHNKAEYSGTGIGLALCKKIVELHGGKIWVESVIGGGSTFYFTILKTKATNTVKNDVSFIPSTTS